MFSLALKHGFLKIKPVKGEKDFECRPAGYSQKPEDIPVVQMFFSSGSMLPLKSLFLQIICQTFNNVAIQINFY